MGPGATVTGRTRQRINRTKRDQNLNNENFKASELCSRKLWQIVAQTRDETPGAVELRAAVNELTSRRHYLAELAQIGKLGTLNNNA